MKNIDIFEINTEIKKEEIINYIKEIASNNNIDVNKFLLFVRMSDDYTNKLTDYCFYFDEKKYLLACMKCTTKAGHYWIMNPITYGGITGTAVLKEELYKNTHKVVNTYRFGFLDKELIQIKPVYIYRDGNKDDKINRDKLQYGYYGINVHTSGLTTIIDRWSAGCLTIYKPEWDWFKTRYLNINDLFSIELIHINDLKRKIKNI